MRTPRTGKVNLFCPAEDRVERIGRAPPGPLPTLEGHLVYWTFEWTTRALAARFRREMVLAGHPIKAPSTPLCMPALGCTWVHSPAVRDVPAILMYELWPPTVQPAPLADPGPQHQPAPGRAVSWGCLGPCVCVGSASSIHSVCYEKRNTDCRQRRRLLRNTIRGAGGPALG